MLALAQVSQARKEMAEAANFCFQRPILGVWGSVGPGPSGPAGPAGPAKTTRARVRHKLWHAHFLRGRGTTHITNHERGSLCQRQRLRGMPAQAANSSTQMQPCLSLRTASRKQDPGGPWIRAACSSRR